jgi:hypothetical protein
MMRELIQQLVNKAPSFLFVLVEFGVVKSTVDTWNSWLFSISGLLTRAPVSVLCLKP